MTAIDSMLFLYPGSVVIRVRNYGARREAVANGLITAALVR
jgi:hypothetical protein